MSVPYLKIGKYTGAIEQVWGDAKSRGQIMVVCGTPSVLTFYAIGNRGREVRLRLSTENMNRYTNLWKSMVFQFMEVNKIILRESVEEEGLEL